MIDKNGFLMIEPQNAATEPIRDDLTAATDILLSLAEKGTAWRGWHTCVCGATSGNCDLYVIIGVKKYLTNSLAAHYVACHRDEIPREQMVLVYSLAGR